MEHSYAIILRRLLFDKHAPCPRYRTLVIALKHILRNTVRKIFTMAHRRRKEDRRGL